MGSKLNMEVVIPTSAACRFMALEKRKCNIGNQANNGDQHKDAQKCKQGQRANTRSVAFILPCDPFRLTDPVTSKMSHNFRNYARNNKTNEQNNETQKNAFTQAFTHGHFEKIKNICKIGK